MSTKKRIAVVGLEKAGVNEFLANISPFEQKYNIEIEPFVYCHKTYNLYDSLDEKGYKPKDFSAAVSVGGDGTFLYTSRVFAGSDTAIFGVNKGKIGFNTNIEEIEFEKFFELFINNKAEYEHKVLLDVEIEGDTTKYVVLNDGVISHTGISRMISLRVDLEGHPICNFKGDGLIISSPTGSTAYNLSAGGPILHPSVDAYVVCPICPHTLALRPYIIPLDEVVKITVEESASQAQITLDGQKIIMLKPGQTVKFKRSKKTVKIIKGSKNFSERLKIKLGWMV